jgi:poly [ADP-ribose] polymerase
MEVKLIYVSADNKNKFYDMKLVGDTVHIERGRIGYAPIIEKPLSGGLNAMLKQKADKIKKGYKDVTEFKVTVSKAGFDYDGLDAASQRLFNFLLEKSRHFVAETFVSSSFTQQQADKIEQLLNKMSTMTNSTANDTLIELLTISPRKIKRIPDFIAEKLESSKTFEKFLESERETLDNIKLSMSSQVAQNSGAKAMDFANVSEMRLVTDKTELQKVFDLTDKFEKFSHKIKNVFAVTSTISETRYQLHKKTYGDCEKLLFHGSRTENWMSIVKTTLDVAPQNVQIAGKMVGNGIYFADKFKKSKGYTSASGSYWSKGSDKTAFMAIYAVNMSKPLVSNKHQSWMYDLNLKNILSRNSRSFHFKGGVDLVNDEFIVYENDACSIRYILEFEA